jgi:hypothetical protein
MAGTISNAAANKAAKRNHASFMDSVSAARRTRGSINARVV